MLVGLKTSGEFGAVIGDELTVVKEATDGSWLKVPALAKPLPRPPLATAKFESRELA
jgi:hypothetical protein